jgi:hypothetical protein
MKEETEREEKKQCAKAVFHDSGTGSQKDDAAGTGANSRIGYRGQIRERVEKRFGAGERQWGS